MRLRRLQGTGPSRTDPPLRAREASERINVIERPTSVAMAPYSCGMAGPPFKNDRAPTRGADAFECPRCGVYAHQEWFDLKRENYDSYSQQHWTTSAVDSGRVNSLTGEADLWTQPEAADAPQPSQLIGSWAMARCGRCEEYSTWRDDRLIYPTGEAHAPRPHEDMPDDAKALYREAAEVVGISRRAGAALARATLERLLRMLDSMEKRPDLAERIDHVTPKVTVALAKMLTVIRHTGNKSLHVEDEPDDVMVLVLDPDQAEIVELIFESINGLVEELVTRPRQVDAIYDRVPQRIRDEVGKNVPKSNEV